LEFRAVNTVFGASSMPMTRTPESASGVSTLSLVRESRGTIVGKASHGRSEARPHGLPAFMIQLRISSFGRRAILLLPIAVKAVPATIFRSEEHTSELQS